MKRLTRTAVFIAGSMLLSTFFPFPSPIAQADFPVSVSQAAGSVCGFDADLEALKALREEEVSGDRAAAELSLRTRILGEILACAAEEARGLRDAMTALPVGSDLELRRVTREFVSTFEEVIARYEHARGNLEAMDIEETKALANDLRAWRLSSYLPARENAKNFILWKKNQDLIRTAEWRLNYISQTIHALQLGERAEVRAPLAKAAQYLEYANIANRKERRLFTEAHTPAEDALYLAQATLESLAEVYRNFFEVNAAVKKVLPR